MGVKGTIAWQFMTNKVSQKILQSLYEFYSNQLFMNTSDPAEINSKLREAGLFVGERLLVDYADRIKKHAGKFEEFASTLALAYKVNAGHEPTEAYYDPEKRSVIISDTNCAFCEGVELPEDLKEIHYCEIVSGIFEAVLQLRGFQGTVEEISCKTHGAKACTWELRQTG